MRWFMVPACWQWRHGGLRLAPGALPPRPAYLPTTAFCLLLPSVRICWHFRGTYRGVATPAACPHSHLCSSPCSVLLPLLFVAPMSVVVLDQGCSLGVPPPT